MHERQDEVAEVDHDRRESLQCKVLCVRYQMGILRGEHARDLTSDGGSLRTCVTPHADDL